ncbi:WSSV197 [White spot syndrome virus]|uniref:WSSV197 n=1 Tax=White spot syndrome virus TaxID=342409 RepID=A0A2I6SBU6_9VIRU|nr:WSSV197 [White spot syndrome virus]
MDHSRAFACIRLPGTSQARGWNVWIIIELFTGMWRHDTEQFQNQKLD